jgi:hypothetical protein
MFQRISSGGVTTSLILPGFSPTVKRFLMGRSANNIGGEAYVVKLRQPPSLEVEEMLIQYNVTTKHERWSIFLTLLGLTLVKMACGENPK